MSAKLPGDSVLPVASALFCIIKTKATSQISVSCTVQTWGQGLLQLLGLLLVCDDQGVQVPAAAHLELDIVLVLLDLYG